MTQQTKQAMKHHAWKWVGSLVMDLKTDSNGKTHLAVSLSKLQKLLSLVMAVALFVTMLFMWTLRSEVVADAGTVTDPIPDSMLYTLWGLLGLTGANQFASALVKKSNGP
jgi:hypothetical protein